MIINLFETENYRDYMRLALSRQPENKGKRADLARFLSCQTSFVSQVLTDRAHLSLEHALKVTEFLHLSLEETEYFMLLVQRDRAGSVDLKEHFQNSLNQIKSNRQVISERIRVRKTLTDEDRATYYSQWWYAAIHILTACPEINNVEIIATRLKISKDVATEALAFLQKTGLVKLTKLGFGIGEARIHLPAKSTLVSRHHGNWRIKALEAAEQMDPRNLHYSSVIALSRQDAQKIRALILELLQQSEQILDKSPCQNLFGMTLDLFEIT